MGWDSRMRRDKHTAAMKGRRKLRIGKSGRMGRCIFEFCSEVCGE